MEQDPVSTMQKTGLTNYKRVSLLDLIIRARSTAIFCVLGHFWHGDTQTNEQTTRCPSASLLLTSEKAVFCKISQKGQLF